MSDEWAQHTHCSLRLVGFRILDVSKEPIAAGIPQAISNPGRRRKNQAIPLVIVVSLTYIRFAPAYIVKTVIMGMVINE